MNRIFKIHIINWVEHNPGKKKSHKKTLICNNIINDGKISALPAGHRWLFLGLLLIAGDNASDTVTITERQVNELLTTRVGASNALDRLQSLQLVTYEILKTSLIKNNRIVTKKKNNGIITEGNSAVVEKLPQRTCVIDELNFNKTASALFKKCTEDIQLAWLAAYPSSEWIVQECLKANAWMQANPKKAPKDFQRFFTNWLAKGFESYRKGIPSRRQTASEVNATSLQDLYNKVSNEKS